jgi:demethylmenaquinone methyltransferase/2-methoxy-6-polyprenyl-1,4-benzoquinol methylase
MELHPALRWFLGVEDPRSPIGKAGFMPPTSHSTERTEQAAYTADAPNYDQRTRAYQLWRRQIVDLLPLQPGDVVIDAGCGTGLCFPMVQDRIGPSGRILAVDMAPDMLSLAAQRAADHGWRNVTLQLAPAEEVSFPITADHALFCAVHDVMQSDAALRNVLSQVRPGGHVVAGGGKWAAPWAVGLNLMAANTHSPFVRDFAGFDKPWAVLARHVVDLRVLDVAMGCGFLAVGRMPGGQDAVRPRVSD